MSLLSVDTQEVQRSCRDYGIDETVHYSHHLRLVPELQIRGKGVTSQG